MTEQFIEVTEADEADGDRLVLINLRAVSHIATHPTDKEVTAVYFNQDEYLLVRQGYDQIIEALGWIRQKKP